MDENRIKDTLSKRPRHRLVKNDLHDICNRIREIDDGYFILRNVNTGRYEGHNVHNIGDTYCFTIPYDRLDKRTLDYCRETSVERNVAEMIEAHNAKKEKSMERAEKNDMENRSRELAERMAYAVDEDTIHKGYKRTHYVSSVGGEK